jgi:4,5-DOPA dioxygenase extradiol
MSRMPALFVGHGSPMNAVEDNQYTRAWRQLGLSLPKPRAILSVSAHWYTRSIAVTADEHPKTIHDFYGFPQPLYQVTYPAPGDGALVARVQALLRPRNVTADRDWGLDHGTWSVLRHVYPDASTPCVQLSIDSTLSADEHYAIGRRLAPLRDEGVLIFGSGNVVHNLRAAKWGEEDSPYPWATAFNAHIREAILNWEHQAVVNPALFGEGATLSIPTPEHYLPLLYVLGSMAHGESVAFPTDGIQLGSISMLAVLAG